MRYPMQVSKKIILGILSFSLIAAVAPAQTISIVSGDGQVAPQNFQAQLPMTVVVKNAQGQPQSGVAVTWTVTGNTGSLSNNQTTTDANGQTSVFYLGNSLFGVNFSQAVITASIGSSSVNFTETTSASDPSGSNAPFVQANVVFPTLG